MRRSERALGEIEEAALASYVATASEGSGSLKDSRVAFAFTYLASPLHARPAHRTGSCPADGLHREPPGCLELHSVRAQGVVRLRTPSVGMVFGGEIQHFQRRELTLPRSPRPAPGTRRAARR